MSDDARPIDDEKLLTPRNILAVVLVGLFCAVTLLPYQFTIPNGRTGDLIAGNAETVKNLMLLVAGFYFGDAMASRRKDKALAASVEATATLASTAQTAGEALAAATPTPGSVTLPPGESVNVAAADTPTSPEV